MPKRELKLEPDCYGVLTGTSGGEPPWHYDSQYDGDTPMKSLHTDATLNIKQHSCRRRKLDTRSFPLEEEQWHGVP